MPGFAKYNLMRPETFRLSQHSVGDEPGSCNDTLQATGPEGVMS